MADKVVGIKIDVQDSGRLSQLEQNLVKLGQRRRELNKLVREGTTLTDKEAKELGELGTQAQATRNKINDLKNGILKQKDALKKNSGFVAGVRKGMGQWATSMIGVTAAIAAGTKIIGHAVKVIKDFDESVADLAKTTGLSKDAARDLAKELLKIDTRTSVTELLALGTAAGRLGLEGEELIGFVEQTDKAFVALGDSLSGNAEEIGLSLGKIAANFGIEEEFGIAESINKIGSSLNELGANSKAQEGAIQDFTARLSGVAKQAGLTVPEVQALGALFDESGQSIEVASTTFNQLLPLMGKEVEKFAEVAGVNVDEFSKLVRDKPFEALKLVAEGAKSSDEGLIGLTETLENYGVKSSRAASIVGVLSEKTVRLGELQQIANDAFEEGTSLADEFAIKNDTLAAKTEKLSNNWDKFILSVEDGDGVLSVVIGGVVDLLDEAVKEFTLLNKTSEQVISDIFDRYKKSIQEAAKGQALETKKQLQELGLQGEELAKALDRALLRQSEFSRQAKERGENNLAATYASEVVELKKLADELRNVKEESAGDNEESTELTDREIAAINEKARKRAEAQREAELKAIEDREAQDTQDEQGGFDAEIDRLIEEEIQKAEIPASIRKEIRDRETEEFIEDLDKRQAAEERALEQTKAIEQAKRDARRATFDITADFFNLGASLAKEGSIAQRGLASAAALVQTYQAAQAAYLSQLSIPTPSAPIRAAAAASVAVATGLANVAKINSVKYQSGGVLNGASHANGGIPFTVAGRAGFEAEGGEAIINKKSTQMFAPLLSAINEAGGGVAFSKGGKIKKFANGGIPDNLSVSSAQQGFLQSQLNLEEFSNTIIEGINNKQVINVASNTSDVATEVFNTQSEATF